MANSDIQDILATLDAYDRDPESCGIDTRLIFSRIVLRQLAANGWTQRDLANRTGFKEAFISRIVHSDANFTADTFGRILFAFGISAKQVLMERDSYGEEETSVSQKGDTATDLRIISFPEAGSSEGVRFAARARSEHQVDLG